MRQVHCRGFVKRIGIVHFADNELRPRNAEVAVHRSGFVEDALTAIQLPFYRPLESDTAANLFGNLLGRQLAI